MMARVRLDRALAERGLVGSREKAKALILAGRVRVRGETVRRADRPVSVEEVLEVTPGRDYVSRGGGKLAPALDTFAVRVEGRICADIGASTGGFTDVLLRRGAIRVFAVDVGRGLLDWSLRQDPRVTLMERVNARELRSFSQPVSLITVDVSFIGLEKVLPALLRSAPTAEVVALFKPQFQVGRHQIGSGGIVRDPEATAQALDAFCLWCPENGYRVGGQVASSLAGADGNREILVHLLPEAQA